MTSNIDNINLLSFDPFTAKYHMIESNQACFISLNPVCSICAKFILIPDRSIKNLGQNEMINLIITPENLPIQEYMS